MSGEGGWVKIRNFPIFYAPNGTRCHKGAAGAALGEDALGTPPKPAGSPQKRPVWTPKLPSSDPKIAQFGANHPKNSQFGAGPGGLEAPRVFLKDLGLREGEIGTLRRETAGKAKPTLRGWGNTGKNGGETPGKRGEKKWENAGKNGRKRGKKGKTTHREERGVGGEREFDAVVIKVGIAAGPGHPGGSRLEFMRENRGWNSDNFRLAGAERGSLTLSGASESRL